MAIDKASSFGAITDHFNILAIVHGVGTLADVLSLVASSRKPRAQNRGKAHVLDDNRIDPKALRAVYVRLYSRNSFFVIDALLKCFHIQSQLLSMALK